MSYILTFLGGMFAMLFLVAICTAGAQADRPTPPVAYDEAFCRRIKVMYETALSEKIES